MAGYADDYSMSMNALTAYDDGLVPLSKLPKIKGVTSANIRAIVPAEEWHHTSARYNRTKFYCPTCVGFAFDLTDGCDEHRPDVDRDRGWAARLIEQNRDKLTELLAQPEPTDKLERADWNYATYALATAIGDPIPARLTIESE